MAQFYKKNYVENKKEPTFSQVNAANIESKFGSTSRVFFLLIKFNYFYIDNN